VVVALVGSSSRWRTWASRRWNRAVKEGWQVEFATPPVRVNGRGYQATFSLPMGVTPEMIADKREVLARNLVRAPLEVWPTAAERAGCGSMGRRPRLDRAARPCWRARGW
jgi:hypothetical protein